MKVARTPVHPHNKRDRRSLFSKSTPTNLVDRWELYFDDRYKFEIYSRQAFGRLPSISSRIFFHRWKSDRGTESERRLREACLHCRWIASKERTVSGDEFFFLIVAWVGLSGSGKLDFDSFYRVACHFQEEDDEALQKELKEAFRLYDKEGNGYIPTSSLREILAALDDQITPDQMDGMIAEIDTDGSGTVDFDGEYHVSSNYPILSFACPLTQETLHRESKLCYRYLFRTIEQLKKVR